MHSTLTDQRSGLHQVNEVRAAVTLVVTDGTAMHQQLSDVSGDVDWSLRIAGGGATPFRTWLALQTLLLDPGQACPLAQQIVSGPLSVPVERGTKF